MGRVETYHYHRDVVLVAERLQQDGLHVRRGIVGPGVGQETQEGVVDVLLQVGYGREEATDQPSLDLGPGDYAPDGTADVASVDKRCHGLRNVSKSRSFVTFRSMRGRRSEIITCSFSRTFLGSLLRCTSWLCWRRIIFAYPLFPS